jgi:hypothetical protein
MLRFAQGLTCLVLPLAAVSVQACTIFVLTDESHALFCNNEDFSNPKTRIWFMPESVGHLGCAIVGYDDGFPQGGVNSTGLALDWVAGFSDKWELDAPIPDAAGYSSLRVLETCSTVQGAIDFYRSHPEPGFGYARILVADRTGASVIIGASHGKLLVESATQCRGFGYGGRTLDRLLARHPAPTEANATEILHACLQRGRYATKYSTVYDMKSGEILVFPLGAPSNEVRLNLAAEIARGGHYYDMPQLSEQLGQLQQPLLPCMKRMLVDQASPAKGEVPAVTARVRAILHDLREGILHREAMSPELWKEEEATLKSTQMIVRAWGDLVSLTLVDSGTEGDDHVYRYRVEFTKSVLLQRFVFDPRDKLVTASQEDIEASSPHHSERPPSS